MSYTNILRLLLMLAGYMVFVNIQLANGYDFTKKVSCGCHEAKSCGHCGKHPHMCNGDCVWKGCVSKKDCPKQKCPKTSGANVTNSSLQGYRENPGNFSWKELRNLSESINGTELSCLGLPKLVFKDDKCHPKCLNYSGLHTDKCPNYNPYTQNTLKCGNISCMTPYQFLTNRNYMKIDWKPFLIVTAETQHDIMEAIKFAGKFNLTVSVMSTGHDGQDRNAGPGNNSLLIRTTCFTDFKAHFTPIESANGIMWYDGYAEVGAGLTFGPNYWWSLPNAEGLYELARNVSREIVGGACNSVGIVGWTLGGGRGWTAPKYGLGVDQLLHVDMVLANGKHISANYKENQDIFYAIRGGGGGFGVIYFLKIKLHNASCGENWTDCYSAKAFYLTEKYSSTSRYVVGNITQKYMNWTLNDGKYNWNSAITFKYDCNTKNYSIWIWANCLGKNDPNKLNCIEFDNLNTTIINYIQTIYKETSNIDIETSNLKPDESKKSDYWSYYGTDTGEPSTNSRWEQRVSALVNSSAATNDFVRDILDYWQPRCDQNPKNKCLSGFFIESNLPALCETNSYRPGCQNLYNTSVYNSGGPIPNDTRSASFIVFNYCYLCSTPRESNVVSNKGSLTLEQKEEWLHKHLAPVIYKYSSRSYFNEGEYTLHSVHDRKDSGEMTWQERFWGNDIYCNLLKIKEKYDPKYMFGCRHCVGSEQICS